MKRILASAALAAALLTGPFLAAPASAEPLCDKLGFAGLLAKCNRETLPPITLASGKPLAEGPLNLQSGGYYKIDIVSDGSAELAIWGPAFFRAVWINEVVINDLEIRPLGIDSFEFDDLTKQKVAKIHPESVEFSSVQDYDSELYLLALQAAGVPVEIPEEPVNWVFQDFDEDVDIVRAAAELGITVQELSAQLGGLGPDLQALQDGVVKREVFLLNFAQAVCDLNIGITGACGGTAGSVPTGLPGFP